MKTEINPRPQAREARRTSIQDNRKPVFASLSANITAVIPAIESLFLPKGDENPWPESVTRDLSVKTQISKRSSLADKLRWLYQTADMQTDPVRMADRGILDATRLRTVYEELTAFMEREENGARLLLYLPFALIPSASIPKRLPELNSVISEFRITCRNAWRTLLEDKDIRADFNHGDIVEPELSSDPTPMVIKAAHLIPILVLKRIIEVGDVLVILQETKDEVLCRSIVDTFAVLKQMNLLSEFHIGVMKASEHRMVRFAGNIISEQARPEPKNNIHVEQDKKWLKQAGIEIEEKLKELSTVFTVNACDIPLKRARVAWLHKEAMRKMMNKYAAEIATGIITGTLSAKHMKTFISKAQSVQAQVIGVRAVRMAIEQIVPLSPNLAVTLRKLYDPIIRSSWNVAPDVQEEIEILLSRWKILGVIDGGYIKTFSIPLPDPWEPLSLHAVIKTNQAKEVWAIAESIVGHEDLLRMVYPVVLMYGSQVKGYGLSGADCDIALFVRPEISFSERGKLHQLIDSVVQDGSLKNRPMEFWLSEDNTIRSSSEFDPSIGDASLLHVLFGGVWIGSLDATKQLHAGLLKNYFFLNNSLIRRRLLKELERGHLQYRLMHKGYAKLFPEQKDHSITYLPEIDSESMFWDIGYRKLATVLFVEKVFIPIL